MKQLNIGDHVIYTDAHGIEHDAVVTHVWQSVGGLPGCNVVHVSGDDSKTDPYGRQIERATSVVHRSMQPANAFCWHSPDKS